VDYIRDLTDTLGDYVLLYWRWLAGGVVAVLLLVAVLLVFLLPSGSSNLSAANQPTAACTQAAASLEQFTKAHTYAQATTPQLLVLYHTLLQELATHCPAATTAKISSTVIRPWLAPVPH
jgi:type II secretory pathway pseudopilin PulG